MEYLAVLRVSLTRTNRLVTVNLAVWFLAQGTSLCSTCAVMPWHRFSLYEKNVMCSLCHAGEKDSVARTEDETTGDKNTSVCICFASP